MNIERFVCDSWTEQQRVLYDRITKEERQYPNCIVAALGYLGIHQEGIFDAEKAFRYIEEITETTESPDFGALAVWYSNPIQLMTTNTPVITPVRHAGIVLGTRFGSLYVFDQMRGRLHVDTVNETTQRADEFSRERYREKYKGIVAIRYHPLGAVNKS